MICHHLLELTGYVCQPINEQGSLARISTPFCFADGDPLPVYVEAFDNGVFRFFDDGQTLLHFMGRGMKFETGHRLRFLNNIAEKHGASVSSAGVLELLSQGARPEAAFAKYIGCMLAVVEWETEHQGVDADGSAFATMVAHALLDLYPGFDFQLHPTYLGSSGKRHQLDFKIGATGYLAIHPSTQSAAPALYKLVDITNRQTNAHEDLVVVVDDRSDALAAKRTHEVFRGIASQVIDFTKIARASPPVH